MTFGGVTTATVHAFTRWWVERVQALAASAWAAVRADRRAPFAFFVYAALIAGVTPPAVSWGIRLAFYAFAAFVFSIVWDRRVEPSMRALTATERRWFRALLCLAGATLLISRILPFLRYGEAPLGYDTGFYLSSIDSTIGGIISGLGHRSTRALVWLPMAWLGIPKIVYLHGLYVLTQFGIAGSLYAFVRTIPALPRLAYGVTVAFLFAVSIPQFFVYWWMYYQTEIAIAFLLLTLTLLHRRSPFALLTGGFGAALHPATSLPFAVALVLFLVVQLIRSLVRLRPLDADARFLLILAVIGTLLASRFIDQIDPFVRTYLRATAFTYGWFLRGYPVHLQPQMSGLYVTLPVVHLAAIYLLPFVCLSITLFVFRSLTSDPRASRRFLFLVIYGVVLLVLNLTGVIYANRYLVYLDLVLIMIAAPAFVRFVRRLLQDRVGSVVVILLGAGLLFYGGRIVAKQEAHITPAELAEVKAIGARAEPDAYAMTTISHYTPWVNAFSGLATIDPGYFRYNRWDYSQWQEFWSGKSNARRHELLRYYSRPIFVFVGSNAFEENLPYTRFIQTDPAFVRVSPHVWRYDPRTVTSQDIAAMREAETADPQ
ncbi:hypothetical protein HY634_04160 [Candidatus Uhrbacteria bacterium]|nr:hypothetical protein [Candidatus Uhrbacteria bacterium]